MAITNMLRARAVPILAVTALGSGIYWQTHTGKVQATSRATGDPSTKIPVSETLQNIGRQGGQYARKEKLVYDPKDTRMLSQSPSADSKRNPQKVRDE